MGLLPGHETIKCRRERFGMGGSSGGLGMGVVRFCAEGYTTTSEPSRVEASDAITAGSALAVKSFLLPQGIHDFEPKVVAKVTSHPVRHSSELIDSSPLDRPSSITMSPNAIAAH